MGKDKLIMKKPKKPMNAMEAYRRKTKEKEKLKHKNHRQEHRETRQREEIEKHQAVKSFKSFDKDLEDDEELEDDGGDFMDPSTVQQILAEKRRMQELRHDRSNINSNIQDLMQTFSKKPTSMLSLPQRQAVATSQTNTAKEETGLSSFLNDNIIQNFNLQKDQSQSKPVFPSNVQQHQTTGTQKTLVGDKRLQKRESAGGNIDPFMMTTMKGDYNPTQKKKNAEAEEEQPDSMQGSYVSRAPGVFQSTHQIASKPVISAEPTVIVKEAALTMAPLRSQMEKEKASLIPVHLLRKKAASKPEPEVAPKPTNQLASNFGIQNVTNVPAPKMGFIMPQPMQQNTVQNDTLSAFLSEINQLDDGN